MKHRTIAASIAALALTAAHAADPAAALLQACTGLGKYSADVTLSPPVLVPADLTSQRLRGWSEVHTIKGIVSARPSAKVAGDFKAAGQRCQFDVSVDLKTVAVSKRACMALCKGESYATISKNGVPSVAYFGVDGSEQFNR